MPTKENPPPDSGETTGQKVVLTVVVAVLVIGAGLIVWLAKPIPLGTRLFVAGMDIALAIVIALLSRQRFKS